MTEGPPRTEESREKPKEETPEEEEVRREEAEEEKEEEKTPEEKLAEKQEKLAASIEKVIKAFDELYEKTGDLSLAFSQLSEQIRNGTIKDFEQLSKIMKWFEEKQKAKAEKIRRAAEKAKSATEGSKTAAEAEEESRKATKEFVEDYESIYKGLHEVAEAVAGNKELLKAVLEQEGVEGVTPSARVPRYEKGKEKEQADWFERQLRRVEERDQSFSENWRMIWPMETFLSSIPTDEPEAKAFYQELAKKFEDRRRLHDYRWLYGRAAGTEPILNASSILSTGAIERVISQEGVTEAMKKFEKLAEDIYDAREKGGKGDVLKNKMGRLMRGEIDIDIDEEGNVEEITPEQKAKEIAEQVRGMRKKEREKKEKGLKEEFEDRLAQNRLGGRLFVVLGFTASYDIDDFAAGDFFVARLIHLKNRFVSVSEKEGGRWFGRDKLWKRFKPELFGQNYAGGLLANIRGFSGKEGMLEKYGLRLEKTPKEKEVDGRRRQVIKIDDPEKLKQLDLKKEGVEKESVLVEWADYVWKADQGRKMLIGVNGYLDIPTMGSFLELGKDFEHVKGDPRWQFFSLMYHDLADFHTGPGLFDRIKERKLWEPFKIKDPKTGEFIPSGWTFIRSDAENLGLDRGWSLGEVHKHAEDAQRANMFLKQYIEGVLREKIKLFGLPGIGPIRFTREMLDYIGWGGLLGMILAPILEFFKQLGKQLETR